VSAPGRTRDALLTALLVAAAALPRLLHLDADPAAFAQYHFISDEGLYAHAARDHALFGRWVMDEHNAPLVTAPLHTLLVRAAYAGFGVGLWQTRLPGALAGILTCLLPWVLLRARFGRRAAFTAALMLAASTFTVSHHRIAYTESLQLLGVTLAVLGLWRARGNGSWGVLAAAGCAVALAAKVSSLPILAVLAVQWGAMLRESGPVAVHARRAARGFLLTGALLGAVVFAVFVVPHADLARAEFASAARLAVSATPAVSALDRTLWFGFREDPDAARSPGGLFAQEPVLVGAVLVWIVAGLLRGSPRRPRGGAAAAVTDAGPRHEADRGSLVIACHAWIGIALAGIATHPSFSPDRRYLLIVPPLAILLALAAFRDAAREPSAAPRSNAPGALHRLRVPAAWAVAALALSLVLRPLALSAAPGWFAALAPEAAAELSRRTLLAAAWLVSCALAAWVWLPALRHRVRPLGPRAALAACTLSVFGGAWHAADIVWAPRWTLRDAGRGIERATRSANGAAVAAGTTAETLALESRLFCLVVRDWPHAGAFTNLMGLARLNPAWAIVTWTTAGRPVVGSESFALDGFREAGAWPVWTDASGGARFRAVLYARSVAPVAPESGIPAP
jgi:4-amino-4-deoxy-L-arabinose transferase-like glycosyltransferase